MTGTLYAEQTNQKCEQVHKELKVMASQNGFAQKRGEKKIKNGKKGLPTCRLDQVNIDGTKLVHMYSNRHEHIVHNLVRTSNLMACFENLMASLVLHLQQLNTNVKQNTSEGTINKLLFKKKIIKKMKRKSKTKYG